MERQRCFPTYVLAVCVLLSCALVACGDREGIASRLSARGGAPVGSRTLILPDGPLGAPVTLELWYPAEDEGRGEAVSPAGAPYPLIVFSHGFAGSRLGMSEYTSHLASHGYVVAAPDYPDPRVEGTDAQLFPDVVPFVIDELFEPDGDSTSFLGGVIDPSAIGASGHSLGGYITVAATLRDPRIRASAPISSFVSDFSFRDFLDRTTPMILFAGTEDTTVSFPSQERLFAGFNVPKFFVVLEGGTHGGVQDAAENPPGLLAAGEQLRLLKLLATAFFRVFLEGKEDARSLLTPEFAAGQQNLGLQVELVPGPPPEEGLFTLTIVLGEVGPVEDPSCAAAGTLLPQFPLPPVPVSVSISAGMIVVLHDGKEEVGEVIGDEVRFPFVQENLFGQPVTLSLEMVGVADPDGDISGRAEGRLEATDLPVVGDLDCFVRGTFDLAAE